VSRGASPFNKVLDDITERIHYVNLLGNVGTLLGFNALHVIVLNPHSPSDLISFDTYGDCNYTSFDYEEFLKR
jgi:hypothetical protein